VLFELRNFDFNLCSKQYNKINLLKLIVAPHLTGGWQHYHSAKKSRSGHAKEQPIYYLISMGLTYQK
jgi:hypothetical protein